VKKKLAQNLIGYAIEKRDGDYFECLFRSLPLNHNYVELQE